MRISLWDLPPIHTLTGSLRTMDCFACVWCIFTDCTVEQRSLMTAAFKTGVGDKKIIRVLNKYYPEFGWAWVPMSYERPYQIAIGSAAIIFLRHSGDKYHYTILTHQSDDTFVNYDPQSKTEETFDFANTEYQILNAYIPRGRGELHFGKLPEVTIPYQYLSKRPTEQGKQNKIYYEILYYLDKVRKMFMVQDNIEDELVELRDIGEYINGLNRTKLVGRDQLYARRMLNVEYMRHYNSLIGFRADELIEIEHPLKLKETNNLVQVTRQKPTKSKFTPSKRNSARTRKNKRKTKRLQTIQSALSF